MSEPKTYTKDELDAAIEAAKEAQDQKNRELLAEVKDLKAKVRASQEIKPEDLAAIEARAEKAEADLKALQGQVKTLTTERDKAVKALETESGFTQRLLVENGLTEALTAAGVKEAPHLKAVKALFAPQVKIEADGETRVAKLGDKALADAIKEWAASDEGKFFVSAPNNGGGDARGGKGGDGGKTMTRSEYDADPVKGARMIREGYAIVNEAA